MSEPVALLDALIYTQPEVSRPLSGGRHLDDVAVGGGMALFINPLLPSSDQVCAEPNGHPALLAHQNLFSGPHIIPFVSLNPTELCTAQT